jgi:hypothetical protein
MYGSLRLPSVHVVCMYGSFPRLYVQVRHLYGRKQVLSKEEMRFYLLLHQLLKFLLEDIFIAIYIAGVGVDNLAAGVGNDGKGDALDVQLSF